LINSREHPIITGSAFPEETFSIAESSCHLHARPCGVNLFTEIESMAAKTLPIVLASASDRWECRNCGVCCRGSEIPLSDIDLKKLQSQRWGEHPDFRGTKTVVPVSPFSNKKRLAHRDDGSCVFLDERGLCRIHSQFGEDQKPLICQVFPLQLVPRAKHGMLAIRRACPTSAADLGKPGKEYLHRAQQWIRDDALTVPDISAPAIKPGESRGWEAVDFVFHSVERMFSDLRFPLVRRVVHVAQFAENLARANTRRWTDSKFKELVSTLEELVPDESKAFFESRTPPNGLAKLMLRQMAIEFARLHPNYRYEGKWYRRFDHSQMSWRFARGVGNTPSLEPVFRSIPFSEIEKPLGAVAPEVDWVLDRFFGASSASGIYAIADRRGWSLVESLRAMVILYPISHWLLRWTTHGRRPELEDMVRLVVALDRAQGYGPLSSWRHRTRVNLLSSLQQSERLVVWYAQ
jgi:lysine-N-methylase